MNPAVRRVLLGCAPAAVLMGMAVSPAGAQTCGPPDFRVSLISPQRLSFSTRAAPELPSGTAQPAGVKRASGKHVGAGAALAGSAGVVTAALLMGAVGAGPAGARASPAALGTQRGWERQKPLPVPPLFPGEPAPVDWPGAIDPLVPIIPFVPVPPLLPGGSGDPGTTAPPGSGVTGRSGSTGLVALNPEPGAALLFLPGLLVVGMVLRRRPL